MGSNYRECIFSLLKSFPTVTGLLVPTITKGLSFPNFNTKNFFFQLRMLVRLKPQRGGDGTIHGIIAMNDTGSDILTLFDTDLLHLGNIQGYTGWPGPVAVGNANGTVGVYPLIHVQ